MKGRGKIAEPVATPYVPARHRDGESDRRADEPHARSIANDGPVPTEIAIRDDEEQDLAAVRELGRHLRCSHDSQAIDARVAVLLPKRR